jgi:CheY-like chemotaxis protein
MVTKQNTFVLVDRGILRGSLDPGPLQARHERSIRKSSINHQARIGNTRWTRKNIMRPCPFLLRKEGIMEKILCVDDDLSLLHLYQDELTEEGFKVILAKDGKEALVKFAKEKPNVVVMDIRMPIMDGIETLTAMLGKDRQVPVILNTAYPQYKENFMTWGAEAYVLKSSDLTELKQTIRAVLDRRKKGKKS